VCGLGQEGKGAYVLINWKCIYVVGAVEIRLLMIILVFYAWSVIP
jgi:hypothetical protein